jgi:hypothetical protein
MDPKTSGCRHRAPSSPSSYRPLQPARPKLDVDYAWAGTHTRIPRSPVRRSRSAPRRWHAGRFYLPAREPRAAEAHPVYPLSRCKPCVQVLLGTLLARVYGRDPEGSPRGSHRSAPLLSVHACSRVLLNCRVRCPQSINVIDVLVERSEPLFPISPCCLTYPLERAECIFPALSPERVTLGRVPLGQPPSLRRLRCRSLGFVRRLRRYCGAVRLPTSVRHRRASFDFPTRSALLSSADRRGISRFPRRMVPCMLGVFDRAGARCTLRWRCTRCCLPLISRASAP